MFHILGRTLQNGQKLPSPGVRLKSEGTFADCIGPYIGGRFVILNIFFNRFIINIHIFFLVYNLFNFPLFISHFLNNYLSTSCSNFLYEFELIEYKKGNLNSNIFLLHRNDLSVQMHSIVLILNGNDNSRRTHSIRSWMGT